MDGVDQTLLDHVTRTLKFIPFQYNWAEGLKQLLKKLESIKCPRALPNGRRIAAETFLGNDVRSEKKETLFSNCFRVHQIPEVIYRFKSRKTIPKEKLNILKLEWSYRKTDPHTFLSFHSPPTSIIKEYGITEKGGGLWPEVEKIDGIWSLNLVSELIRKALIVKCYQKGLRYCPGTKQLYFPSDLVKNNKLYLIRPDDGSKTYVSANGKRKHSSGGEYLYSLAPNFFVRQDLFGGFTVLIRIRVRLSDIAGKAFTTKQKIDSRRKHLCKNWWNKEWFNPTLAISQFLAAEGKITIDEPKDTRIVNGKPKDTRITIDATPFCINAPVGINEKQLSELNWERPELIRNYDEFSDGDIRDEETGDN